MLRLLARLVRRYPQPTCFCSCLLPPAGPSHFVVACRHLPVPSSSNLGAGGRGGARCSLVAPHVFAKTYTRVSCQLLVRGILLHLVVDPALHRGQPPCVPDPSPRQNTTGTALPAGPRCLLAGAPMPAAGLSAHKQVVMAYKPHNSASQPSGSWASTGLHINSMAYTIAAPLLVALSCPISSLASACCHFLATAGLLPLQPTYNLNATANLSLSPRSRWHRPGPPNCGRLPVCVCAADLGRSHPLRAHTVAGMCSQQKPVCAGARAATFLLGRSMHMAVHQHCSQPTATHRPLPSKK
jgi:hypothetical protein